MAIHSSFNEMEQYGGLILDFIFTRNPFLILYTHMLGGIATGVMNFPLFSLP